ncbi:RHS repeat protein [Rhizobium leguminosarum]|nr:RHS repeat protein [Rhizobium leguminosarum]
MNRKLMKRIWSTKGRPAVLALLMAIFLVPGVASSTVNYRYDRDGRLAAARYDSGICIAYTYDENGNRTSQTTSISAPVWGSAAWGCFQWTPG